MKEFSKGCIHAHLPALYSNFAALVMKSGFDVRLVGDPTRVSPTPKNEWGTEILLSNVVGNRNRATYVLIKKLLKCIVLGTIFSKWCVSEMLHADCRNED